MTRQRVSQRYRRKGQEESIGDDLPLVAPKRSSAIMTVEEAAPLPFPKLYPTISNLQRHGVGIGNPIDDDEESDEQDILPSQCQYPSRQMSNNDNQINHPNRRQRPQHQRHLSHEIVEEIEPALEVVSLARPNHHLIRYLSEVTMPIDLMSFDGSEFEQIPSSDDYLDDEELELYLKQLAREEEQKAQKQEPLGRVVTRERDAIRDMIRSLEGIEGVDDEYLDRIIEEQMQAENQYLSLGSSPCISQCSV